MHRLLSLGDARNQLALLDAEPDEESAPINKPLALADAVKPLALMDAQPDKESAPILGAQVRPRKPTCEKTASRLTRRAPKPACAPRTDMVSPAFCQNAGAATCPGFRMSVDKPCTAASAGAEDSAETFTGGCHSGLVGFEAHVGLQAPLAAPPQLPPLRLSTQTSASKPRLSRHRAAVAAASAMSLDLECRSESELPLKACELMPASPMQRMSKAKSFRRLQSALSAAALGGAVCSKPPPHAAWRQECNAAWNMPMSRMDAVMAW